MSAYVTLPELEGNAVRDRMSALLAARSAARAIARVDAAEGVRDDPVPVDPEVLAWLETTEVLDAEADVALSRLAQLLGDLARTEGVWHRRQHGSEWETSPKGKILKEAAADLDRVLDNARCARALDEVLALSRSTS